MPSLAHPQFFKCYLSPQCGVGPQPGASIYLSRPPHIKNTSLINHIRSNYEPNIQSSDPGLGPRSSSNDDGEATKRPPANKDCSVVHNHIRAPLTRANAMFRTTTFFVALRCFWPPQIRLSIHPQSPSERYAAFCLRDTSRGRCPARRGDFGGPNFLGVESLKLPTIVFRLCVRLISWL